MNLTDALIISATLLSPLIAVQATRFLDERNEIHSRKLRIFKTLMSTRAYSLSSAHVEALNTIDLEFSQKRKSEKLVLDVWQQYLDHLGKISMEPNMWAEKRLDLLVDLLYAMGQSLGYGFNKTQIRNGTYVPGAHGRIENEQMQIRGMLVEVLEGRRTLPVNLTNTSAPDNSTSSKPIDQSTL